MLLIDFSPNYKAEFMAKQIANKAADLASGMSVQPRGKLKVKTKKKTYTGNRPKTGLTLKESAASARAGAQGWGGTGAGPWNVAKGQGGGKYGTYVR